MENAIQKYKYNFLQYSLTSKKKFKDAYEEAEKEMDKLTSNSNQPIEPTKKLFDFNIQSPPTIKTNVWTVGVLGLISLVLVVL
jgi:heme oxygenase